MKRPTTWEDWFAHVRNVRRLVKAARAVTRATFDVTGDSVEVDLSAFEDLELAVSEFDTDRNGDLT